MSYVNLEKERPRCRVLGDGPKRTRSIDARRKPSLGQAANQWTGSQPLAHTGTRPLAKERQKGVGAEHAVSSLAYRMHRLDHLLPTPSSHKTRIHNAGQVSRSLTNYLWAGFVRKRTSHSFVWTNIAPINLYKIGWCPLQQLYVVLRSLYKLNIWSFQ